MKNLELIKGDSLEIMKELADKSVGAVVTEPPYGMSYKSGRRKKETAYDKIKNDDNLDFLEDFVAESYRILSDNSAFYCFCSWHNIDKFKAVIEKYFKIKNILVWVKNNHGSGDLLAAYAPKHEFIIYANKGRSKFREGRHPDVLNFKKVSGSKSVHPTEKPVDLLEFLIKNNTDEGDIIIDPFMGSGSTGVAATNLGRGFIGIELEDEYFKIANERICDDSDDVVGELRND